MISVLIIGHYGFRKPLPKIVSLAEEPICRPCHTAEEDAMYARLWMQKSNSKEKQFNVGW